MANPDHLALLKQGVGPWRAWRAEHPDEIPNLSYADLTAADLTRADLCLAGLHEADLSEANLYQADLRGADLSGADLRGADLSLARLSEADLHGARLSTTKLTGANLGGANLRGANLSMTKLSGANLREADLREADLREADLRGANLRSMDLSRVNLRKADLTKADLTKANLREADLREADLREADFIKADLHGARLNGANLSGANLSTATCSRVDFTQAVLVRTNLEGADLTGAKVYGIAAWDLELTGAVQQDLTITPSNAASRITVDDLEVAQFIYLMLNNKRVRKVIDTITSKVVLILGRFTPERKAVLDALREELRKRDYLPIVFDFETPDSRDLTETVSTLAHMAKFVIADLTDAKSLPQELTSIVPVLPSVPVQPILLASEREYAMYEHFSRYPWVLPIVRYETTVELLTNLGERVIVPAERRRAAGKG